MERARAGVDGDAVRGAVKQGKLRAARLGGRRELRFLAEWIDAWLLASSTPEIINTTAPGDDVARDRVESATATH